MKLLDNVRRALVEALGGSLLGDRSGVDSDRELIGFRPISERYGRKQRDLTWQSHFDAINMALYLYSSNALAQFLIDMPVSLVVGQELGYTVAINADDAKMSPDDARKTTAAIRKELDRFWYHPAHNISEKAPEYAVTFLVTGHLVLPVTAVNDVNGVPQLDLIDAAQISGVDALNGSAIVPGIVRFRPNEALAQKEMAYLIIQPNREDGLIVPQPPDQVKTDAPLPNGIELKGQCLYFRYNKLLNSMRGVSHLLDVADWLDALDQFAWASLDRAKLRNAIVWHLKMQGLQGEVLEKETAKLTAALTSPGSVYGSNGEVELVALNADLGAADTVELGRMILTHILGSKGIPESWYSHGGNSNRATAGEQTDVAYKKLLAMQTRLRNIYRAMLWMAYDSLSTKQSGVFPKRTESPWLTLEPNMPVVQERDMSRMAAAAGQLASALEGAISTQLISERSSRRAFLDVLGQITSGAYELDIEEAQIETETAVRDKRQAEMAAQLAQQKIGLALGGGGGGNGGPPAGGNPAGMKEAVEVPALPALELHAHLHDERPHAPAAPTPVTVESHQHTTVQPAPVTVLEAEPAAPPVVLVEQHTHVAPSPAPAVTVVQEAMKGPLQVQITDVPTTAQEVERGRDGKRITRTVTRTVKE